MEANYGWPVAHREGWPDLSGGEADFYTAIQQFNARSRNIKAVFINQFGFDPKSCGRQMPGDMEFMDIRKGADVEFGQSIYEPFGIAQFEPLTFGGDLRRHQRLRLRGFPPGRYGGAAGAERHPRRLHPARGSPVRRYRGPACRSTKSVRDRIEAVEAARVANEIMDRLPKSDARRSS